MTDNSSAAYPLDIRNLGQDWIAGVLPKYIGAVTIRRTGFEEYDEHRGQSILTLVGDSHHLRQL